MKTLTFTVNTYFGMDCSFCSHDDYENFDVELEDEDAAKIESAVEGKETLTQEEIEQLCPDAAETIDWEASSVKHAMCVIDGWDNYGQGACGKSLNELFEENLKSGEFSFTPENADEMDEDDIYQAQFDAWWEAEAAKMDAMTLCEKAEYLEYHYELDTDSSCIEYDYEFLNPKLTSNSGS